MAFVQDDLWCYILRRTAEGPRFLPEPDLLRKAKVDLRKKKVYLNHYQQKEPERDDSLAEEI